MSITTIAEAQSLVQSFVHERDWEVFHRPRSLAIAIAVEAAELLDELKWIADDEIEEPLPADLANRLRDELADVTILCLAFFNRLEQDAGEAIVQKVADNAEKYPVELFKGRWR